MTNIYTAEQLTAIVTWLRECAESLPVGQREPLRKLYDKAVEQLVDAVNQQK